MAFVNVFPEKQAGCGAAFFIILKAKRKQLLPSLRLQPGKQLVCNYNIMDGLIVNLNSDNRLSPKVGVDAVCKTLCNQCLESRIGHFLIFLGI